MAKILNVGIKEFKERISNKKIILWGAGRVAHSYVLRFCKNLNIIYAIDKNEKLHGKYLTIEDHKYPIYSEKKLIEDIKNNKEIQNDIILLITSTVYAGEIMKHINSIKEFEYLECYVGVLLGNYCEPTSFNFTEGNAKISKKIHYCWFGKNEIPDHIKKYMESWHVCCPDFEIIRWDESNYDISKNRYMKEAYECKKWGFVPDYARLDIIYNEGGIYLDTDVEVLKPLEIFLNDDMFCGFGGNMGINLGCGFGAIKKHNLIKQLRDYYDDKTFFLENGEMNLISCIEYQNPILEQFGFSLNNSYQKRNGVVVCPSDVLLTSLDIDNRHMTENTVAIHHVEGSWLSVKERQAYKQLKQEISSI